MEHGVISTMAKARSQAFSFGAHDPKIIVFQLQMLMV